MENKNGLHGKYYIQKIVTVPNPNFSATAKVSQVINNHDNFIKALKPVDENSEYFVLRLDIHQKDSKHREACLRALKTYADEIKAHLPELSVDLYKRYYLEQYTARIAQPEAERYTRADLIKAGELGQDFSSGCAHTVKYDTIEEMLAAYIPVKLEADREDIGQWEFLSDGGWVECTKKEAWLFRKKGLMVRLGYWQPCYNCVDGRSHYIDNDVRDCPICMGESNVPIFFTEPLPPAPKEGNKG